MTEMNILQPKLTQNDKQITKNNQNVINSKLLNMMIKDCYDKSSY